MFENLTKDQILKIAIGVGKGFQSFDPNNPLSGAGAALSTTSGLALESEERKASEEKARMERQQAVADARADRLLARDEEREYEEKRYKRRREEAKEDRESNREAETAAILARERELANIRKEERGAYRSIFDGVRQKSSPDGPPRIPGSAPERFRLQMEDIDNLLNLKIPKGPTR